MIVYHFSWDLRYFGFITADVAEDPGWRIFARLIAGGFIFVSGVSLVLATRNGLHLDRYVKRLAILVAAAASITLVTWFVFPDNFIFFGILHHIALASVLGLAFIRAPLPMVIAAAVLCFALPPLLAGPPSTTPRSSGWGWHPISRAPTTSCRCSRGSAWYWPKSRRRGLPRRLPPAFRLLQESAATANGIRGRFSGWAGTALPSISCTSRSSWDSPTSPPRSRRRTSSASSRPSWKAAPSPASNGDGGRTLQADLRMPGGSLAGRGPLGRPHARDAERGSDAALFRAGRFLPRGAWRALTPPVDRSREAAIYSPLLSRSAGRAGLFAGVWSGGTIRTMR